MLRNFTIRDRDIPPIKWDTLINTRPATFVSTICASFEKLIAVQGTATFVASPKQLLLPTA
jgi:hypothetical protein